MTVNRRKYDAEFKKNAAKLSYTSPKTIKEAAEDLGQPSSPNFRSFPSVHCWRRIFLSARDRARIDAIGDDWARDKAAASLLFGEGSKDLERLQFLYIPDNTKTGSTEL